MTITCRLIYSPLAGPGYFLCSPKESNQRKEFPGSPRKIGDWPAVRVCPWFSFPLRCSTKPAVCATREPSAPIHTDQIDIAIATRTTFQLAQCSTETPAWSALLGGSQGPQDQKP